MALPQVFAAGGRRDSRKSNRDLLILKWWRRGELNPRPKKPVVKRTTCVSGSLIFDLRFKAGESGEGLARLSFNRRLRTEAFGLSRKMTLTHHRAGSVAGAAT